MPRLKKCKECLNQFEVNPFKPLQVVCSPICAQSYAKKQREGQQKKDWAKRKSELKRGFKTKSDYCAELQKLVNRYVRKRDEEQPCISCRGRIKKGDAGHFFSVGQYPSVRFDLDNIHLQCVSCNHHQGGNVHEYRKNLVYKIGEKRLSELEERANKRSDLSATEIQDMIDEFKKKLKNE